MSEERQVIRGAPRYLTGSAAGGEGVLAIVPEAEAGPDGRIVRPTAIIALPRGGARRYEIGAGAPVPWRRFGSGRAARSLRHPVPRLPAAPASGRPPPPSSDPRMAGDDLAESWIISGGPAPAEDPRIAAAFGPSRTTAEGISIPLLEIAYGPGAAAPRLTPIGTVEIAGGEVSVRLRRTGAGGWGWAALAAWVLFGVGWARWRRRRN